MPWTHAELLGRAALTPGGSDYRAYYDGVLNITWLVDVTPAGRGKAPTADLNWDPAAAAQLS